MRVCSLSLSGYRNLKDVSIDFSEGVTLLCGDNGQGKTNLLEAVYFFSLGGGFRAGKDRDCIAFDSEEAVLRSSFISGGTEKDCAIRLTQSAKSIVLCGERITRRGDLLGVLCCILFTPDHMRLVKSGPAERRSFMDIAISQQKPRYAAAISESTRIIANKNKIFKDMRERKNISTLLDTLDIFNEKLAPPAAYIALERAAYVARLGRTAAKYMDELGGGEEELSLSFVGPEGFDGRFSEKEAVSYFRDRLTTAVTAETQAGFSLTGPHRDDMDILINGRPAKLYASQGQQRSAVLSIKLAEGELLEECYDEPPIYLLDDILSELDPRRQSYITEAIKGRQVIVTACGGSFDYSGADRFEVSGGTLRRL